MYPFHQSKTALTFGTPQLHLVVQSLCRRAVPSQPFFVLEGSARNLRIPGISAASFLNFCIQSLIMYPLDDTRIHPKQRFVNPFFRVLSHCTDYVPIFVHARQTVGYKKIFLRRLLQKTCDLQSRWRSHVFSFFYSSRFLKYPSAQ